MHLKKDIGVGKLIFPPSMLGIPRDAMIRSLEGSMNLTFYVGYLVTASLT